MIFNSYAEQREELAGIRMVSCGHIFANHGREIYRPAGRNDWLLFYVAKESDTFFLDRTVTADAGSVILFAPGEKQHHIYEGNKTAEFYYVHFQCDRLPVGFELETSCVYSLSHPSQTVAVLEEIIDETLRKNPHYELLCVSRLLHLLSMIQRERSASDDQKKTPWNSVAYAIQHMNRYCNENRRLEEYAAMCCMSKYHFLRVFRQVTGRTPLEYRNEIRIRHARELLENSFLSVSEIGETLGYTSPAYFSDAFKRQIGISPATYRKKFFS